MTSDMILFPTSLFDALLSSFAPARPERPNRPCAWRRGYNTAWWKFRAAYAEAHPFECADCGKGPEQVPQRHRHLDHVVAKSKMGATSTANVEWRCQGCHSRKTVKHDGGFGRLMNWSFDGANATASAQPVAQCAAA